MRTVAQTTWKTLVSCLPSEPRRSGGVTTGLLLISRLSGFWGKQRDSSGNRQLGQCHTGQCYTLL